MPEPSINRGLAGVVVDTSAISKVMEDSNSLTYRGYAVQDLAANCRFEEVAYLLWQGELPNPRQLAEFEAAERSHRRISPALLAVIEQLPPASHPMDALRTAISFLGAEDPAGGDRSEPGLRLASLKMMAKIPTIIAAHRHLARGERPLAPRDDLGFAENFLTLCFGAMPDAATTRCFDVALTLYAEHGFNASTFAARVIASTLSDIYSAVVGATGALKGPLHGGANEAVMAMMLAIGDPAKARDWLLAALAEKRVVMGFGHRVYKHGDSRVPTMAEAFRTMAALRNGARWIEIYDSLASTMLEAKGLHPNLDFPAGPAYYLMGFEIPLFTPLFVISRIVGWTAHVIEQSADNKLIRPLSAYSGPTERSFVTLEQR